VVTDVVTDNQERVCAAGAISCARRMNISIGEPTVFVELMQPLAVAVVR
jgi:hypothetical protein